MKDYILITGASSSIGRATAVLLSKKYPLILGGRDEKRLQETRFMCENKNEHLLWNYDLAKIEKISDSLSLLLRDEDIHVEGFIHSAGIAPIVPLHMITMEEMMEIMNINFFSAAMILKVLASKKTNGTALRNVVFVSSISSKWGARGMSLYTASKGALDSFARSIAFELSPRVRVNTVLPGGIAVRENDCLSEKADRKSGYLLGEGKVEDIATVIEFFLSDSARWVTGQNFVVDGGRMSHC